MEDIGQEMIDFDHVMEDISHLFASFGFKCDAAGDEIYSTRNAGFLELSIGRGCLTVTI